MAGQNAQLAGASSRDELARAKADEPATKFLSKLLLFWDMFCCIKDYHMHLPPVALLVILAAYALISYKYITQ